MKLGVYGVRDVVYAMAYDFGGIGIAIDVILTSLQMFRVNVHGMLMSCQRNTPHMIGNGRLHIGMCVGDGW